MLEDKTGGPKMRRFDYVNKFDYIGMGKLFHDVILSLDFLWVDRKKDLDGHRLFGLLMKPEEDMGVFASADLFDYGIVGLGSMI